MLNIFRKKNGLSDEEVFKKEYLKKSVLSYPPRHITIGVTSACNNKCLFCSYHGKEAGGGKSNVYGLPFMLTMEDFKRIVDMAYAGNVPEVHICGTGEPFLNPRILDMIDYVIRVYGKVSFQTNFWKVLFDKNNFLDEIVKRKEQIRFITTDVLSSDPEEHERIKNGASYHELLEQLSYISKHSKIRINANVILTRSNCKNLIGIIDDFERFNINNVLLMVSNLMSYDYSEFTSSKNVYTSKDTEITDMLTELKKYGEKQGIDISIPNPADKTEQICNMFWSKFQTWPVKGCEEGRYGENMITCACAAVVLGKLNSLGYLFDYDNIMDAWNNPKLVSIRENLLKGRYPDEHCRQCYLYNKEDSYYKTSIK